MAEKSKQPQNQIAENIETKVAEDEDYSDIEKLRLEVKRRIDEAVAYFENNFHTRWDEMANLYRGLRARAAQMLEWQNNFVSSKPFGVSQQVYAACMQGLYPKEKLFSLTPREQTENAKIAASGWKQVMLVQSKKMHLRRNMGWTVTDGIICDYGISKYGWKFETKVKKYLDWKTGKVEAVEEPQKISTPFIKSISPFDFLSDLDAMSWEEQEWTAERIAVSMDEIESDPTYNMNDEIAAVKIWLKTKSQDEPVGRLLYGWEYHTCDTVLVILDECDKIVKKHYTLLKSNEIPYIPFCLFPEQRTPGGMGLLNNIKGSLQYIDKLMNANADNMDLALRAPWTLKSNSNISFTKLDISLDKIFKVDANDELQRMQIPGPDLGAYREIQLHEKFIDGVSGGNQPYESDTATESKLNALQGTAKVRETIEYNQDEMLVPMLRAWLNMNQQFMEAKEVTATVGPTKAKQMKLESQGIDYNVDVEIELTGEASEVERLIEVDNLTQFTNLAQAIASLPPDIQPGLLSELVNLFGYKDKIKLGGANVNEGDKQKLLAIKAEAEAMAKEQGVKPEDIMNGLATKMQMTPEQLMKAVIGAGSIKAFVGGAV